MRATVRRTAALLGLATAAVAAGPAPAAAADRVAATATAAAPVPAAASAGSSAAAGDAAARQQDAAWLAARRLLIPVEGVRASELRHTFADRRDGGGRPHEALDILAPRGTPVFAVDDGRLVKLFTSVPGGLTVYQFDPSGRYAYYYAHLDRYADGLKEGMALARGDLIGHVGSTGNASPDTPHLHFAIFRLGPERQWWKGTPVDPYPLLAPDAARR